MTQRLTLSQKRGRETRQNILDASGRIFARRGYGGATMEEIAGEAEISVGALYHHFASKEELFKELLKERMRSDFASMAALVPSDSFRGMIERFVAFQLDHIESDLESRGLSMEFWAQATREPWAREPVAEFHRRARDVFAGVLRLGQRAGVVRGDLDADAGAFLLLAVFEGVATLRALDKDSFALSGLEQPWADLIERFIEGAGGVESAAFEEQLADLFQRLGDELAAPVNESAGGSGVHDGA